MGDLHGHGQCHPAGQRYALEQVTFKDGTKVIGTRTLEGWQSGHRHVHDVQPLARVAHDQAMYGGDGDFATSSLGADP